MFASQGALLLGNTIKGPITNTNDIIGCKGNVMVAIANETGEFRADVVNMRGIIWLNGSFNTLPVKNEQQKITTKKTNKGGNNLTNNIVFPQRIRNGGI